MEGIHTLDQQDSSSPVSASLLITIFSSKSTLYLIIALSSALIGLSTGLVIFAGLTGIGTTAFAFAESIVAGVGAALVCGFGLSMLADCADKANQAPQTGSMLG